MRRRVLVASALVMLLGTFACSDKSPVSLGQNWEVFVVAEEGDWRAVGALIQETLEKPLSTPLEEKEYVVQHVPPEEFEKHMTMRNLIIVSSLEPGSETARILRRALDDEVYDRLVSGEEYLLVARNQWAREQFLLVIAAPGQAALRQSLETYPDYLYTLINENRNRKVRDLLFHRTYGRLEKRLKKMYAWSLKIPVGYQVVYQDTANRLVQLTKANPDRNLFIHWVEEAQRMPVSEDWLLQKVNWMSRFYQDGYVAQGEYFTTVERWKGHEVLMLVGLWKSDTHHIGGPMRAYAFRDADSGRVYVLFTNVFAPDRRKEPYLRELDAIVETFRAFPSHSGKALS